jgi:hypothetical protein
MDAAAAREAVAKAAKETALKVIKVKATKATQDLEAVMKAKAEAEAKAAPKAGIIKGGKVVNHPAA